MTTDLNPMALFGTAGIRGPLSKVSPEVCMNVGMALATYLGNDGKVVVARDGRITGQMLFHALTSGIMAGGVDVLDAGRLPTPLLAFASYNYVVDGGVMLTASHNPASDNGIKLFTPDGSEFDLTTEQQVEELVSDTSFNLARWDEIGTLRTMDTVLDEYIDYLLGFVELERELRVVIDCANGVGALVAPQVLRRMGCKVITTNSQLDGFFPGRPAEPTPENIREFTQVVRSTGADIGFALDGDADRVAVVDSDGTIVQDDALINLFSRLAIEQQGGGTVVTSINTSRAIQETVEAAGGTLKRVRLGALHEGIKETGAVFGAEPWKLIFPEFGGWIDGIFCAARIAALVSREGSLADLVPPVPAYPLIRKNVYVTQGTQPDIMSHVHERMLTTFSNVESMLDIDGLRLDTPDGWLLVRASGTEPKIRVVAEGRTDRIANDYFLKGMGFVEEAVGKSE